MAQPPKSSKARDDCPACTPTATALSVTAKNSISRSRRPKRTGTSAIIVSRLAIAQLKEHLADGGKAEIGGIAHIEAGRVDAERLDRRLQKGIVRPRTGRGGKKRKPRVCVKKLEVEGVI